jgi:N-acetylmuramoyl-L-alanine amidase
MIRGRSLIAAFTASAILLLFTEAAYPSYNTEAGHKYTVACQRLADLRKSPKKKKYRSYWMDCIRTFELVEKKYPKSPSAGDACFDRAGVYQDLYQFNRYSKDLEEAIRLNGKCQAAYPRHARAPEALYHIIELSPDYKKDKSLAATTFAKLWEAYPDSSWTAKARERLGTVAPLARKKKKQEPEFRKMPVPVIASTKNGKPDGVVKNIRYWSGGAYTRIVIDQDKQPIKFLTQELKKPDRLVFDLLNTRLDPTVDKDPLPVNDGILRQVRASQYAPDIVRVVLDLASIKSYAAFPLHDPDRLVIDVTGEEGRTPEPVPSTSVSSTQQSAAQQEEVESAGTETQAEAEPEAPATIPTPTPPPPSPPVRRAAPNKSDEAKLSLSRQLGLKIKTIAIDAGHGGHDPGALGKSGLREKTITLDVAKRLAALVKERLGVNVIMTRDRDVFIPLEQRPFIAKSKGADLFVSIHVNANRKRKARGIETYIQSLQASDRDAMATAARENAMSTKKLSELKSELDRIFADLTRDDKLEESLQLAHAVQGSLVDTMKPVKGHVVNLGVKRAFFYVLINTEMPSILAEVGFISNPEEEKLLRKDTYRQSIAEALYQGVKKYVDSRSPQMIGI